MIRVCYVIGQLGKGGAEKQLYELVKGLDRDKFTPFVISLSQGGWWSNEIKKLNIDFIELERKKSKDIGRLFRLAKIMKDIRPDIAHTFLLSANVYGRAAAILNRVPVIIGSERSAAEAGRDKNLKTIYLDKFFAMFSHGVICNSSRGADNLVNKWSIDAKKVFTVHNGIDVNHLKKGPLAKINKVPGETCIGAVGRLYSPKNYKLFIDMAKIVLDNALGENIKFLIVGGGPLLDELTKYCRTLGVEPYFSFAGEMHDPSGALETMDIYVNTSGHEGLSNAIMEAMAAELPVVATDAGGNNELVIHGKTGLICPPNDARCLAGRVLGLIEDKDNAKKMGKSGQKRMVGEFGIDKMVKETEEIYLKLYENHQ